WPVKVVKLTETLPEPVRLVTLLKRPAPLAPVLFVKVSKLSDRKADPVLLTTKARPPPLPEPALLPVRVLLNSDSEPSLSMPAPRSETLPLAMVRPEIDTLVPRRVWKTRWALLPLTVMVAAPGPWTVRLWSMAP